MLQSRKVSIFEPQLVKYSEGDYDFMYRKKEFYLEEILKRCILYTR